MCVSGKDSVPPQAHSLSASVFRKSPSESFNTQQGGPATQWHNKNSGQTVGHSFFLLICLVEINEPSTFIWTDDNNVR